MKPSLTLRPARARETSPWTARALRPLLDRSRGCPLSGGLTEPLTRALTAIALAAVTVSAGCLAPEGWTEAPTDIDTDEPVASAAAPILWGEPTTGDRAVVALLARDGLPYCTGTVIAPRLVLTAAHCISVGQGEPTSVFFGFDVPARGASLPVQASVVYAGYDPDTLLGDLAVVELAEPALVPYVRVSTTPMDQGWIDYPARMVGFGYTGPEDGGQAGVKYHAWEAIDEVDDTRFRYGEATCQGDSGGPAFATFDGEEAIIGVTSSGPPDCRDYGRSIRVDVYSDWIGAEMWRVDPDWCTESGRCPGELDLTTLALDECAPDEVCPPAGCSAAAGHAGGHGAALAAILLWLAARQTRQQTARRARRQAQRQTR